MTKLKKGGQIILTLKIDNIPDEIKQIPCWVGWKKGNRNGKITKIPVDPRTGLAGDATNTKKWGSFNQALNAVKKYNLDGIGFVFTPEYGYVGIDIDHCVSEDGRLSQLAQDIIEEINSYTEFSPSGNGIHIICRGEIPKGKRKDSRLGLEIYNDTRFFTVTGDVLPGHIGTVENRTAQIKRIFERYLGENHKTTIQSTLFLNDNGLTEDEIIEKATRSKNGSKFAQLYYGRWEGLYPSHSEADIAFCNMLAFWTGKDIGKMDILYRRSGLYRRKWDDRHGERTYGETVLQKAIENCHTIYSRPVPRRIAQTKPQEAIEPITDDKKTESLPDWYEVTKSGSVKFLPGILAKHLATTIPAINYGGQALLYKNGVYTSATEEELRSITKTYMIDRYCLYSGIRDATKQWMLDMPRVEFERENETHIINLRNGLYNVLTGVFSEHSPDSISTLQLNCSYTPGAKCEKFLEYISQVLPEESILITQEILGYLLVPVNKAQKCFILKGPGNSGKSTFLKIIESLLGKDNISNVAMQNISDRFKTACLSGKLANLFGDLPEKAIFDTGIFKTLTGEDRITAERKTEHPFSFTNTARLVFSCNNLPLNYGDKEESFYRRLIILPFENAISADKCNPYLNEELDKEKDGIFLWALQGLERLMKNNFRFTENYLTNKALERYKVENNSVMLFVENYCTLATGESVNRQFLYDTYKQIMINDGMKPETQRRFNQELENLYKGKIFQNEEVKSRRAIWVGIKLNESPNS